MIYGIYGNAVFKKILSGLLIFTFLSVFVGQSSGQTRRRNNSAPAKKQTAGTTAKNDGRACDGWRGNITYLEKKQGSRNTSKGEYGWQKSETHFVKSGEVILNGGHVGKAKMRLESREVKEEESRQKNCCWANLAGCQKETTVVRWHQISIENIAEGEENSNVTIDVQGSRYTINLTLPAMRGKSFFKVAGKTEGACDDKNNTSDQQENTNPDFTHQPTPVTVKGTIDPKNPKTLQGSYQPDENTMITWNLVRAEGDCDEPLRINSLRLAHNQFPNKTEWVDFDDRTVDGNRVRLTATVTNGSKKTKSGTVVFRETTSGETIGTKTVSVPAGGEAEAEIFWDTNGFAWTDTGAKAPERTIVASLAGGDSVEKKIHIVPKPVILVHGLWSNAAAWSDYQSYLNEAHSFAWKAYPVGADPKVALMQTGKSAGNTEPTFSIRQNAEELAKQIRHTRIEENAWHVDIVAHSMGGLISRYYIHHLMTQDAPDSRPTVANLVMLGTPNMGSPCADLMYPTYKFAGFEVEALRQLQTSVVAEFNRTVTNRKGVKFSILAGHPVPRTCQEKNWGDGVVSVRSALWLIADRAFAPRLHTDITGREDFLNFVKPRLALGPTKAKTRAALENNSQNDFYAAVAGIGENWLASLTPFPPVLQTKEPRILFSKSVKIEPGQTVEIPVVIAEKGEFGITFSAPPEVKAMLVRNDGTIRESIESAELFKTFYPDEAGNWTLRFENGGNAEANVFITVWTDEVSPLILEFTEIQAQTDGSLKLQVKLLNNGAPVKGAVVTAKINRDTSITLFDDGKHGDEAAVDGIYGAVTEKLAAGEAFIEAEASTDGATATAQAIVSIGASERL
jgi:Putative serine esterase (DUF676).